MNDDATALDESYFGLMDGITMMINNFVVSVTCTSNAIGETVKDTDFKPDYDKFKAAIEDVFKNELTMCKSMQSELGFNEKMQWVLEPSIYCY